MAMAYTIKRVRRGNTIGATGIMWTFGCETQEVDSSECATTIVGKTDMCLYGGDYYSAQYSAHPGKNAAGQIVYNKTLLTPPLAVAGSCSNMGGASLCNF